MKRLRAIRDWLAHKVWFARLLVAVIFDKPLPK